MNTRKSPEFRSQYSKPSMMGHTYNPSIQKVEAGRGGGQEFKVILSHDVSAVASDEVEDAREPVPGSSSVLN